MTRPWLTVQIKTLDNADKLEEMGQFKFVPTRDA